MTGSFRRSTGETGSSSCRPRPSVDRPEGISLPSKDSRVKRDLPSLPICVERGLEALLAENPAGKLLAQLGEPPYVKLLAELLPSLDENSDLLASWNENLTKALAELLPKR